MLDSRRRIARRALDAQLGAYGAARSQSKPGMGWLRAIRDAIGMTGQQFADRLDVAWQSMDDLEKSEAAGTITVNALTRAAAALECRLVYALVPVEGSLDDLVERRARQIARDTLARVGQTMLLEDQAVSLETIEDRLDDYIVEHIRDRDLWAARAP